MADIKGWIEEPVGFARERGRKKEPSSSYFAGEAFQLDDGPFELVDRQNPCPPARRKAPTRDR